MDRDERLFFSNGSFSNGRCYSFNANLTPRWSVAVSSINIGALAIGKDGTLIVAGIDKLYVYRTPRCRADYNEDEFATGDDFNAFVVASEAGCSRDSEEWSYTVDREK